MRLRSTVLFLVGVVMLASAGAHGILGWPVVATALRQSNPPADLIVGLQIAWYLGSVSMLAFAIIVVIAARRMWSGDRTAAAYLWPIAAACTLFGLGAVIASGFEPQFLLFVGTGGLTALSLVGLSSAHKRAQASKAREEPDR